MIVKADIQEKYHYDINLSRTEQIQLEKIAEKKGLPIQRAFEKLIKESLKCNDHVQVGKTGYVIDPKFLEKARKEIKEERKLQSIVTIRDNAFLENESVKLPSRMGLVPAKNFVEQELWFKKLFPRELKF